MESPVIKWILSAVVALILAPFAGGVWWLAADSWKGCGFFERWIMMAYAALLSCVCALAAWYVLCVIWGY